MTHPEERNDRGEHVTLYEDDGLFVRVIRHICGTVASVGIHTKAEWNAMPRWEGPHPAELETPEEVDAFYLLVNAQAVKKGRRPIRPDGYYWTHDAIDPDDKIEIRLWVNKIAGRWSGGWQEVGCEDLIDDERVQVLSKRLPDLPEIPFAYC